MVYVIQVCWQLAAAAAAEPNQFRPDHARKLSANSVRHVPLLCVEWKIPDVGQRNSPKHVEFYSKNKFEKLEQQAISKPVWHTPLLCVQWKTPDDGQRNCPKHAEFYSENKFEKLVHLVGFIIGTREVQHKMSRGRVPVICPAQSHKVTTNTQARVAI